MSDLRRKLTESFLSKSRRRFWLCIEPIDFFIIAAIGWLIVGLIIIGVV